MTYRLLSLILLVAVVGLSFALWRSFEHRPVNEDSSAAQIKIIQQHRDSLNHVILATQDTLNSVRHVLDGKMRELAKARLNTLKSNQAHEAIHFVPLTDSARVRELARLYPSFRNP